MFPLLFAVAQAALRLFGSTTPSNKDSGVFRPLWRPSNKDSGVFRPLWRPSNKGSGSGAFFAFGFSGRHDGHPSAEKAERLCLLAVMAAIQLGGAHQQCKHSTFAVLGGLRWHTHGGLSTYNCLKLCDQN